jgi:L-aspartate oxidase
MGRRPGRERGEGDAQEARATLQRAMTEGAGVLRSAASLDAAMQAIEKVASSCTDPEVCNLVTVALGLATAAQAREESRGAHTRVDFPDTAGDFCVRLVLQ